MRSETRIVTIERRAIGADDLVLIAHVEEHVGVVERRPCPHAHEFARTDLDDRDAGVVLEVRNDVLRHNAAPFRTLLSYCEDPPDHNRA